MCVIFIAGAKERVTEEMVRRGHEKNPQGIGISWAHKGKVHWKKGLDVETAVKMVDELPLPYIVHCRAASAGTVLGPLGCHPFPIDPEGLNTVEGVTDEVLFHNGFWGAWKNESIEVGKRFRHKVPGGGWSDSRALAWVGSFLGDGFFYMVGEKIAVMKGTGKIDIYGTGWERVGDILCSNMVWQAKRGWGGYHTTAPASLPGVERTGGSSHQDGFSVCQSPQSPAGSQGYWETRLQKKDEGTVRQALVQVLPSVESGDLCVGCGQARATIWMTSRFSGGKCANCFKVTPPIEVGESRLVKKVKEIRDGIITVGRL